MNDFLKRVNDFCTRIENLYLVQDNILVKFKKTCCPDKISKLPYQKINGHVPKAVCALYLEEYFCKIVLQFYYLDLPDFVMYEKINTKYNGSKSIFALTTNAKIREQVKTEYTEQSKLFHKKDNTVDELLETNRQNLIKIQEQYGQLLVILE